MGDRFYGQQQGKLGYKKNPAGSDNKPKPRRLKKDIVTDIEELIDVDLASLEKMTVKDLNVLLNKLQELHR
jgi:hypothetical protein